VIALDEGQYPIDVMMVVRIKIRRAVAVRAVRSGELAWRVRIHRFVSHHGEGAGPRLASAHSNCPVTYTPKRSCLDGCE